MAKELGNAYSIVLSRGTQAGELYYGFYFRLPSLMMLCLFCETK